MKFESCESLSEWAHELLGLELVLILKARLNNGNVQESKTQTAKKKKFMIILLNLGT